ncbi:outer membrane protein assembly factor BamD [Chitinophagaceae bacterium LB-8]|uniref:Outer membrane protein assembly factor BamD n=1 Tax=Paraflavisolibacter caeni TaxID=2982496 RepID=A0A9X2XTX0_9BACT|nr:outer membrane protein assembly factor BamD [Paraflavisolibacter caeni]MCU7548382.1 outer membrane protein assembly factor BamD [Paraflavisolibacter caeni]
MRFLLIAFISLFLVSCQGINKVLKSKDPEYKLRMAEQYYAKKKYTYAQQLYEDVIPFFKGRPEFEDIYYKYAYTAYNQHDYLNAENLFKTYLEAFPNSSRAEEIEFMRAYAFYMQSPKPSLDQTNTLKVIGMMQTFINTHPGSERNKQAADIMEICRNKLETKDFSAAQLYFDIGQFRAAAVSFSSLLNSYPDSPKGDEYKLMTVKSYYRFAELSVEEKKVERFEKVIEECNDFMDRFPQSPLVKQVENYLTLTQSNIKNITNEPSKKTT